MAGWGSDTAISMPEPSKDPILVDLDGGFGMTTGGIAHNMSEEQAAALAKPDYAPAGDI